MAGSDGSENGAPLVLILLVAAAVIFFLGAGLAVFG